MFYSKTTFHLYTMGVIVHRAPCLWCWENRESRRGPAQNVPPTCGPRLTVLSWRGLLSSQTSAESLFGALWLP